MVRHNLVFAEPCSKWQAYGSCRAVGTSDLLLNISLVGTNGAAHGRSVGLISLT